MIDNKTPHLGLPLPDLSNQQDEDVPRIAKALVKLDGHAAETDVMLTGAAEDLGNTAARVVALEENALALSNGIEALGERVSGVEKKSPDLATKDKAGIIKIGAGINLTEDGTASVPSPPPGMIAGGVIPFNGSFGGEESRHPIPRGSDTPDLSWVLCDGGSDGAGGTVPDLRDRFVIGASEAKPAGSKGGNWQATVAAADLSHTHTISSTGAFTITDTYGNSHQHGYTAPNNNNATVVTYVPSDQVSTGRSNSGVYGGGTDWRGGQQAHSHSGGNTLGMSSNASHSHGVTAVSPYYALAYIMKI